MSDTLLNEILARLTLLQASSLRRTVLDWRDHWLTETEYLLTREARSLAVDLEAIHNDWSYFDMELTAPWQKGPDKNRIEDLFNIWAEELEAKLLVAKSELRFALRDEKVPELDVVIGELTNGRLSLQSIPATETLRLGVCESDWKQSLEKIIIENDDSFLEEIRRQVRKIADNLLQGL